MSRSRSKYAPQTVKTSRAANKNPRKNNLGPGRSPGCRRPRCYTGFMLDEIEFRRAAEGAIDALKKHLIVREEEDEAGFEVEEQNGVLNIVFEVPPGKFVITPNTPVRQVWLSALATSFKLDWDAAAEAFFLPRTGEKLIPLVDRLIEENKQR